ncbi:MAG: hypothetical protein LAT50_10435 [Ectothiorhodospiraceae bacterium]|nr:hypothetical protein [Ectothiorhodospiraceae bacterium]
MSDKGAIWLDQKSAELEARTAEPIGTARRPGESLDPIPAARLVAQRWKRIVRWQGAFWIWQDGAYQSLTDEAVRSGAYDTLEGLNERPNANRVSNVLDAMRATLLVDEHMEPPCWLIANKPLERGQVAMRNGILDLASGKLAPPSPDLFTLSALPVSYAPDATAPHWQQFLERLRPDDAEAIQAVQELFGYLISGETHQQKVFLLVGPKRGGKGTILRVLTAMLGRHNVAAPTLGSL